MNKTGLIYHPAYLQHDTGGYHPESPERLLAIYQALENSGTRARLSQPRVPDQPREQIRKWIEKVHKPSHFNNIQSSQPSEGLGSIDGDTILSPGSFAAALLAVEGTMTAVDQVVSKSIRNAFCAVRPPGHHAESNRAMGFCLFNNVAIAARYIQKHYHFEKVFIIDWDVHHGNGTQEIFYEDPTVFYFSVHQSPLYPGTGLEEERGRGKGEATTLNCPLPPGKGDLEYATVFEKVLMPAVEAFRPNFILVSAGFDAHRDDPLANMQLSEAGFIEMTRQVTRWADRFCEGRLVSCLEGGYNLPALSASVQGHLDQLQQGGDNL